MQQAETETMKITDLDNRIINELRSDGGLTNVMIGERLSVPEATVRYRIKRLLESGYLKLIGLINPQKVKEKQIFQLWMQVEKRQELETTAEQLLTYQEVVNVSLVTGQYDIMAEVFVVSTELIHLLKTIDSDSKTSVAKVESIVVLKSYNKWI